MEKSLHIYSNQSLVGDIVFDSAEDKFSLRYSNDWKSSGFALSPHLPLDGGHRPVSIKRFLENLFPEGHNLEMLLDEFKISKGHTFRILQIIGGEPTGAIRFTNTSPQEEKTSFRKVTEEELVERLEARKGLNLVIWDGKPRLSVAGVQDKLPVVILNNGDMGLGEGALASTHILKFQRAGDKIPYLVLNEFICMKLAALVGISVASVEYRKFGSEPVLVVKRFDRNLVNDSLVQRVHIIDGCQALNLPPTHKYERNFGSGKDVKQIRDGASLKALHEVAKSCEVPAIAILQMLNWMIFNLCISNADSHAKNISYFVSKQGLSLTPFYDLVNIAVYPDLEQDLAMSIGDEFQLENVKAFQFSEFCSEINMPKKMFLTQFRKIGKALLASLDQKQGLLPLELSADELMFAESLMDNIKKRTQELLVNVEEVIHI